ncbi:MAG: pyridoxal 5'-phosphate synthase glutaminase subunit PdxT [Simkaniaceae bacterium]|nr:pyridoxal 5'-phosphate synthase glutaminase subunit PdxT [Simkaniaceae bacterium]
MIVGVFGYQGGGALHERALDKAGIARKTVLPDDEPGGFDLLILPGGESSVQYAYCRRYDLIPRITAFARRGKPLLGTCAGTILLSHIRTKEVEGFGLIDIDVERNGYGRQVHSGIKRSDRGRDVMFIRPPKITRAGKGVEISDSYRGDPVLVREKNVYCTTFHPELTGIDAYRDLILRMYTDCYECASLRSV